MSAPGRPPIGNLDEYLDWLEDVWVPWMQGRPPVRRAPRLSLIASPGRVRRSKRRAKLSVVDHAR